MMGEEMINDHALSENQIAFSKDMLNHLPKDVDEFYLRWTLGEALGPFTLKYVFESDYGITRSAFNIKRAVPNVVLGFNQNVFDQLSAASGTTLPRRYSFDNNSPWCYLDYLLVKKIDVIKAARLANTQNFIMPLIVSFVITSVLAFAGMIITDISDYNVYDKRNRLSTKQLLGLYFVSESILFGFLLTTLALVFVGGLLFIGLSSDIVLMSLIVFSIYMVIYLPISFVSMNLIRRISQWR